MRTRAGFTLYEVLIAMAVLAIAFILVGGLFLQSSDSLTYFSDVGTADTVVRRTLDTIAEDLHQAVTIAITPSATYDTVTITRAYGETDSSTVRYTVDAVRDLIRTETAPGPVTTSGVVARKVDNLNAQNAKGFSVVRVGTSNLYTVSLRLVTSLSRGQTITRGYATTVGTRS
jgi:prepilin-type N-terminal cleavage/methylation domain-containing protein